MHIWRTLFPPAVCTAQSSGAPCLVTGMYYRKVCALQQTLSECGRGRVRGKNNILIWLQTGEYPTWIASLGPKFLFLYRTVLVILIGRIITRRVYYVCGDYFSWWGIRLVVCVVRNVIPTNQTRSTGWLSPLLRCVLFSCFTAMVKQATVDCICKMRVYPLQIHDIIELEYIFSRVRPTLTHLGLF